MLKIRKAVVLGSGVMGSQIAAWLAACGIRVHLLDLASSELPEDPKLAKVLKPYGNSLPAALALENLKKLKPSPITSQSILDRIVVGNFEEDISLVAEADWVIEAIIEKIEYKKPLLKKVSEFHKAGIPITTNTSGIPLKDLCKDLPESFGKCFFGTHFFNPPRYMKLLEVIPHEGTDQQLMKHLANWIEQYVGKGIVYANDTINFIANRIGVFNIQATLKYMEKFDLNIETVDMLTGKLLGRPASATFRTMDVVGLDTFAHVAANVYNHIPNDPFHSYFKMPDWISELIQSGKLGQKTGSQGCYLKTKKAGKTQVLAYRPKTKEYTEQDTSTPEWLAGVHKIKDLSQRIKAIYEQKDNSAEFIQAVTTDTFAYSAYLLDEIASGLPKSLDDAMKWGFNWEMGPFELWQSLGYEFVHGKISDKLKGRGDKFEKKVAFYEPAPGSEAWQLFGPKKQWDFTNQRYTPVEQPIQKIKLPKSASLQDPRTVLKNNSASLLDIGDGVACLVFHSKMNTFNQEMLELCQQATALVNKSFSAMVVANDGAHFSAGADLKVILEYATSQNYSGIDNMLRNFQSAMSLFKFAPFPVITAPFGLVLGGGCEAALHGDQRILHMETYAGLVEVGVGLIPGAGGCKELAIRGYENAALGDSANALPFIQKMFMLIGMGKTSTSGQHAIEMGLFEKGSTKLCVSKEHQTSSAKFMALEMLQRGYTAPTPAKVQVLGDPGIQTFKMMLYNMVEGKQISAYDAILGEQVATVLCGGEIDRNSVVTEQQFLDLERRCFITLCKQPKTLERIEFMLKKGKPLRN